MTLANRPTCRTSAKELSISALASVALAVLLMAFLAAPALAAAQTPASYTLEPEEDDDGALTRLKAALRLIGVYNEVELICRQCGHPEILQAYSKANGTVVAQAVKIMRQSSALTPEWRQAVKDFSEAALEEDTAANSCHELGQQIRRGDYALHTGRFLPDYNLMRGR